MGSSTKRAWKLQEFVAHAGTVNCLALGHKSGRVIVTGGEDKKVNMWAVGKPNCIMSLSGHTSPVEAVRFGNAEEMVVAGSLSGALKIWDLEAAKIVRTLTGHKSAIKSLDFHPYGDFVASGSVDTNIKLWDVRRKGCIFTYKGHTNTVGCLRFSPDGRWIASAGDDGLLKMWDLTAGKLLNDFTNHKAAVTSVEFHPNEFLLASGSADRTVKFWDLETFQLVSTTDGESTPVRNIFFHPDGQCLYSAAQDMLKVYGWEPAQCYDSLSIGWGKITDIAMAQNQLIGATYSQSNISTYVVDISRVSPLGGTPVQPVSPVTPPMTASGRRSYISHERPPTASTKQAPAPAEEADENAGKDDDLDDQSEAEIQNPKDYREIFHAKDKLARSPPKNMEPFPAPLDDNVPAPVVVKAAPPPSQPVTSRITKPPSQPAPTRAAEPPPSSAKSSKPPPSKPAAAPQPRSSPPERDKPKAAPPADNGLNPEDFLPRQATPNLMGGGAAQKNVSESEALSLMAKGHGSMMAVMHNRTKNLQIVRALWTSGNVKTACDSAIGMNDKAVIIDILNVLNQKSGLWNLDLCSSLIPQLGDLVTSKYENYTTISCNALRIVLKNFGPVIKSNLAGPPSFGVDITREERYNKCKMCYKELMHIRSMLQDKSSTRGGNFRELQLLLSQLD